MKKVISIIIGLSVFLCVKFTVQYGIGKAIANGNKYTWSTAMKDSFVSSCTERQSAATPNLNVPMVKVYCACLQQKLEHAKAIDVSLHNLKAQASDVQNYYNSTRGRQDATLCESKMLSH